MAIMTVSDRQKRPYLISYHHMPTNIDTKNIETGHNGKKEVSKGIFLIYSSGEAMGYIDVDNKPMFSIKAMRTQKDFDKKMYAV